MTEEEKILIAILRPMKDRNSAAVILETYIQVNGPVSNEAGNEIKKILKELPDELQKS